MLAAREPSKYRTALVATRPQITAWNGRGSEAEPIRQEMVTLATSTPTLMVGLSAQDENIQQVFSEAKGRMGWSWPSDPPAHVFADEGLGDHHGNILRVVYSDDYHANITEVENQHWSEPTQSRS